MRIRFLAFTVALLAAAALWLGVGRAAGPATPPAIWINEFLADNDTVIADEYGQFDDVLELYNAGATTVDLGGMYLTDKLDEPTKFLIADNITLPPGGFLLFWADNTPEQGIYHTNFALSKSGESIGLFDTDANGNVPVDTYSFGAQATDVSEGRCPDGGQTWLFYTTPTMAATNEPCGTPPSISGAGQVPAFPQAGEQVTVTATITDDGIVVAATLWYSTGVDYLPVAMEAQGDRYEALVPGQPQDAWVQYYLEAEDDAGWRSTDPPGAPPAAYSYVSGYEPPPLALNELMADNRTTLEDPDEPGEYPDWFELYNAGSTALDLGGLYLTDYPADPVQFRIPDGVTIPAAGFLVFYADGEPQQGPLHTNFELSAGGEALALVGAGGKVFIDRVQFPALGADAAFGRRPDGTGDWRTVACATPGVSNQTCRPIFLPLVGHAMGPPPLPLRLNCGSDVPYTTLDGTIYLADRGWASGAAYGYLGGYQDLPTGWWEGNPVGGTCDQMLYKAQRIGWQEYRASHIPNGSYLLTLRFEEQQVHGPGLSVFDVAVEGQTILDDFDLYGQVERYYVLDRRFAITIADHELNLVALPAIGETSLAALELVPRQPDSNAPAIPTGLAATSSYGAVLLDWADNAEDDLAGYQVYRADQPQGPYSRLTTLEPAYRSRYQDNVPTPHDPHYYRVSALDVYGNESGRSGHASAAAIDVADATLPLYQLEVSPENLAILYADPFLDTRVPATFAWQGHTLDVEVRFRGNLSRTFDKKSWKIVFPADSPFANHDRINVNATWLDSSMIRARLANDLFAAAGLHPPQAEHVLLTLNGDYRGVYTRNEQVDEGFLLSSGRNPGASVYKVVDRFAQVLPDEAAYRTYYEKETNEDLPYDDLIAFIELINYTPDDSFAGTLSQVMDVESFLDHYAIIILTANFDSATHNIYLVHDLDTGLWELVPWDLDASLTRTEAPIDLGTEEHPEAPGRFSILRTRVLAVPEFRAYFCQRLAEYMDTIFSDAVLFPQVDAMHGAIQPDGLRDWRKIDWEASGRLTSSPGVIKSFVTGRKEFLQGEMQTFCAGE